MRPSEVAVRVTRWATEWFARKDAIPLSPQEDNQQTIFADFFVLMQDEKVVYTGSPPLEILKL